MESLKLSGKKLRSRRLQLKSEREKRRGTILFLTPFAARFIIRGQTAFTYTAFFLKHCEGHLLYDLQSLQV